MLIALVAVGCGSSSSTTSSGTSAPASTQPAAAEQTSSRPRGATPTSKVAGYGSTEAAWNATHAADNSFAPGSAYDSDPSLPEVEGHADARYSDVQREGGRIVAYRYHFPATTIAAAKASLLHGQFPTDAHQVWSAVKLTCALTLIRSDTLIRQLHEAQAGGHHAGETVVEFTSGAEENAYDASAVTAAELSPAISSSPAQAEC